MKNSKVTAKAKAIDTTKEKILYAGAALLAGLMAAAIFSTPARANTATVKQEQGHNKAESEWTPHIQIQDEIKLPFTLKSQKLSH